MVDPKIKTSAKQFKMPLPNGGTLAIGPAPLIMAIVNVTPDSFSDGGKHYNLDAAVDGAVRMAEEGAAILDIGGESTRPGAKTVDIEEEKRRVMPVIEKLAEKVDVPISVDTRKSDVARAALRAGASIVNDVTMLTHDPEIADVAAEHGAPLILSHIKGAPADMQQNPHYDDLWPEIIEALEKQMDVAKSRGVPEESIILDPGIGFGKRLEHNLEILRDLHKLAALGRPVLVGPSRKRFIGDVLNVDVSERLEGTIAACALALERGASIFRVHDVLPVKRALALAAAILA